LIVEGINFAAYRETDSSLYDSDKNRLFGSEHYKSGRHIVKPSPWHAGTPHALNQPKADWKTCSAIKFQILPV